MTHFYTIRRRVQTSTWVAPGMVITVFLLLLLLLCSYIKQVATNIRAVHCIVARSFVSGCFITLTANY